MIFLKLAAAVAAVACTAALAQSSNAPRCQAPETEKALQAIAAEWKASYNGGDSARLARLYDENAWYLTQHFIDGAIHGRSAIRAYFDGGMRAGFRMDSIRILSSGCSGDLAWTVGTYESTNGGEKAFGVNLVVARRAGNQWLIVAHESAVPDPRTAMRRLPSIQ